MRNKLLFSAGVALIAVGCSTQSATPTARLDVEPTTQVSDGITTVSLDVPNMH